MVDFRIKNPQDLIDNSNSDTVKLKGNLTWINLAVMGVAVIVGAGIFTVTAKTAGDYAGPATAVAFIMAAITCAFTAMCYAEFSSTVPVAGSVYTYSYATFGELIAWIVGWNIILEFTLGSAVITKGWSSYLASFFNRADFTLILGNVHIDYGSIALVAVLTFVLAKGVTQSSRLTTFFTVVKLSVVLFVIFSGISKIHLDNYHPFVPPATKVDNGSTSLDSSLLSFFFHNGSTQYGLYGIFAAASVLFFAFIGFDAVATAAEETKNPAKDLPKGIFSSLFIVTILYVAISLVVTGVAPYKALRSKMIDGEMRSATLVTAFEYVNSGWIAKIVSFGAVIGLAGVAMVLLQAGSRVLFAVARDRLLPSFFAKTDNNGSPRAVVILLGVVVAFISGVLPVNRLEEMINAVTLLSFIMVSLGVLVLRKSLPNLKRGYKVPFVPWIPILAVLSCFWLLINLSILTWIRFAVWLLIGIIIYFIYGYRNSLMKVKK